MRRWADTATSTRAATRSPTWSIAAGVQLFYPSRIIGTSVTQIEPDLRALGDGRRGVPRGLLDRFDAKDREYLVESGR
jgi:hypothetical protein